MGRRMRVAARLLVLAGVVFVMGTSSASAGVVLSVTAGGGPFLAAGQTGAPASVTITNASTPPDDTLNITLGAITLVPTCGVFAFTDCPAASVDPGVLAPSFFASGRGSATCRAAIFRTDTVLDATQDKHEITPSLPMTPVVLGPPGTADATCIVDFTVNVLHVPTIGRLPEGSFQTYELAFVSGTASDATPVAGSGTTPLIIGRRGVRLSSQVAPAVIDPGSTVHDTVTFTPVNPPIPTGTVTFELFGPDNPTCHGQPIFTSENPIVDGRATSMDFTLRAPGTYRFNADYHGDDNNAPDGPRGCSDPSEVVVSAPAATLDPPTPLASPPPGPPLVTLPPPPPARTVSFKRSPKTVRVSQSGSFSYSFTATAKSRGSVGLKSTHKVTIGSKKQLMKVKAKAFTATAKRAVTVRLKLSNASLKALKRDRKLKFAVSAVLGGKTFTTTVTLSAPKKKA
jgi:hypothetical protein